MKKVIIFAVAFIAIFAVSLKVNSTPKGIDPNYYCVYFKELGRCYGGDGIACYGVDEDCNWLN